MLLIILIITLIFSFAAFESNLSTSQNILSGYFLNSVQFIGNHFFLFLVSFVIVSFFIFRSLKIEEKHPRKNHILIILTQSLFVFITGIFMSFFLLLILAVIELNFLAYIINLNPKLLGIQTDVTVITNVLKTRSLAPQVSVTNGDHYQELQAVALANTGNNSFYGKYILSEIPSLVVIPTGKIGSVMLIDNNLVISDIQKSDLEKITPAIVYLFIKNYFPDRYIKHFPNASIMNTNEYTKFRKDDYAGKFKTIAKQITDTNNLISSTSALIKSEQASLADNQNLVVSSYAQKDQLYTACVAKGAYNGSGVFVKTNSISYCRSQVVAYDTNVLEANNQIDTFTGLIDKNNKLLKAYQAYADFFNAESKLAGSLENNIPDELGLFVPDNSLKIVLNASSTHGVADYFETVTHEYLHYASHEKSGKTFTAALFEEGLTEYFARHIIAQNLGVNANLGYPVFVKIISQMTKLIPESEFADYYFNKDEKDLESALNRVYGDNFYQDNLVLFETLQYASDNKQLLQFANNLMTKIGGKPLTENDLISDTIN